MDCFLHEYHSKIGSVSHPNVSLHSTFNLKPSIKITAVAQSVGLLVTGDVASGGNAVA